MKRKNATRNALFTSIISLLLCVSMLVGTTFAWFTDEVVSGNNLIAAGNLDVELEYYDGSAWQTVKNATNLFSDELWEPGHTQVVYLKLSNLGTLALKYNLGINVASETEGTNVANETFKLSDSIYMGVVEDAEPSYTTREEAIEAAKAGANGIIGSGYTKSGSMTADADDLYMAVVVYMPETVGNEANYKTGTNRPEINLGIKLFATQLDNEEDSFGDDYDKDLTPVEDGDVLVEENGIQYLYKEGGEVVLYLVPEEYAEDTVEVLEGATRIGNYAFAYNSNVETVVLSSTVRDLGRGFDSNTSIKKVVLNEGLDTISSRAFKSTSALEEVVISSTVTTIADDAFQKTGLKTITIPANVTYVGSQAFGASMIETVIFEGNPTIQNKAFRGCANLRTVYLNGDDVTFENTTGQANCWFCNSESNNPNTSNITFYVKNETVAQRVKTAMGAEAGNTPVYVNGAEYIVVSVSSQEDLNNAVSTSGAVVDVTLKEGNYTLPSVSNGDVTISGTKDTVITIDKPNYTGSDVTLEGVTVKGSGVYTGIQHVDTVTYNNVTVEGEMCLYGNKVVFNSCTFNLGVDQYIWTYGVTEVEFNNCTFNSQGKALLVYGDSPADLSTTCTTYINNCKFYAENAVEGKAAIEIDSRFINQIVYIDDLTTAEGFDIGSISGNTLWNNKKGNAAKVYVNNVEQTLNVAPDA